MTRLKRLAGSGLPVEPLVHSIWGIVGDAIPHSPHMAFLPDPGEPGSAYLGSTKEVYSLLPAVEHYFVDSPPEVSGYRVPYNRDTLTRLFPRKTVWTLKDLAVANFYRTEGYNEVFGKLGWYDGAQVSLQEDGVAVGHYPIWHSWDQRPFGREDLAFLEAAASPITHALKIAQHFPADNLQTSSFVPCDFWGYGVILLDRSGRLIAIDDQARSIFRQLATLDGVRADAFMGGTVRDGMKHLARVIDRIFRVGDSSADLPLVRFYSHWTGATLKLRGALLTGGDGREYINVFVERGESANFRRRRLAYTWGLTRRETEVLDYVAMGKTNAEIGIILGVSPLTAKKHVEKIFLVLGVETRTAAAAMVLGSNAKTPASGVYRQRPGGMHAVDDLRHRKPR